MAIDRPTAPTLSILWQGHVRNVLIFIFASCEPLTENLLSRNAIWWATDNPNYMCHTCAKGFLDANVN